MAVIAPFKGIIYNQDKIPDLARVVAPPYDVVPDEDRALYYQAHPNNVLHIDLGPSLPEDNHPYDWHKRAALLFNRWLAEGVLVRHEEPAVYYTETDFTYPGTSQSLTRHGFVCLLRLEEFGARSKVRPHERTFSEHKAERLDHLLHVQAHLSQIFTVFSEDTRQVQLILEAGLKEKPPFDFTDRKGQGHRLWAVYEPGVIKALAEYMLDRTVYIADGHHRYETALNYRRLKAEQGLKITPDSPLNYLMVYMCSITDPGLAILPAHRLISRTLDRNKNDLEEALKKFFEIKTFSFNVVEERSARQAFLRQLKAEGRNGNVLGLYTKLGKTYYLLKKRPAIPAGTALDAWPGVLRRMDTVVLNSLVFQEVLGMTEENFDDTSRIAYSSVAETAINCVNEGRVELAAILNPTRIQQVQEAAEAGLVMPRKSTYFYPKETTGLVFNFVNPFEEIPPVL